MKVEKIQGFSIIYFVDINGDACSLQESSAAEAVWLGRSERTSERIHLNRELVRELLPYLTRFAETGDLY